MRSLWLTFLLLPAAISAQHDPKYAGVYRTVVRDAKTGKDAYQNTPVSQMRVLRLDKAGKWSWRDFMTGFDGAWTTKGPNLTLHFVNGPGGELLNVPPMRLKASKDGKTLTVLNPSKGFKVSMVWDPTIEQRLRGKYREYLKRNGG